MPAAGHRRAQLLVLLSLYRMQHPHAGSSEKVKIFIDNTVENLYIKEVLSQGIYGDGVVYVRIAGNTGSHGSGRMGIPFKERRHVTHQATPLETPANRGTERRP